MRNGIVSCKRPLKHRREADHEDQRSKTALVNASLSGGQQKDKQTSLADIKKIFGLDEDDSDDEGL